MYKHNRSTQCSCRSLVRTHTHRLPRPSSACWMNARSGKRGWDSPARSLPPFPLTQRAHTHTHTHARTTCTHACMPHEPCALVSQVTVASASDQSDQIQALQEEHDAQNQAILRMQQTIKGDTQKRIRTHTHTSPAHTLFSFCNVTLLSCERMPFVSGFLCCFLQTLKPK